MKWDQTLKQHDLKTSSCLQTKSVQAGEQGQNWMVRDESRDSDTPLTHHPDSGHPSASQHATVTKDQIRRIRELTGERNSERQDNSLYSGIGKLALHYIVCFHSHSLGKAPEGKLQKKGSLKEFERIFA